MARMPFAAALASSGKHFQSPLKTRGRSSGPSAGMCAKRGPLLSTVRVEDEVRAVRHWRGALQRPEYRSLEEEM